MNRNEEDLANCPLCESDKVYVVSGVQFAVKCNNCWHIKVQCFDSPRLAKEAWNKLFDKTNYQLTNY